MPFKETKSTTTTSSARETIKGPTKGQSRTKVASISTTRRKLSRGETAGGLLTGVSQITMIGITLITLSISTAALQFSREDLISLTPNYGVNNEYVGVENPLDHYNYQVYGEDVVDNIMNWIYPLEQTGQAINTFWQTLMEVIGGTDIVDVIEGDFADTFGSPRFHYLVSISRYNVSVYMRLTELEKDWVEDNADNLNYVEENLFGNTKFHFFMYDELYEIYRVFYTEPTIIDMVLEDY
jgi:hypothetical protein